VYTVTQKIDFCSTILLISFFKLYIGIDLSNGIRKSTEGSFVLSNLASDSRGRTDRIVLYIAIAITQQKCKPIYTTHTSSDSTRILLGL